jgi:glycosyltransferase involved in cell wall biosynthesis
MNKLIYLSQIRYPTKKAYGVTVGNTFKVLSKFEIKSLILVWGKIYEDEYGNAISTVSTRPIRFPDFILRSQTKMISRVAFLFNQLLFGFYLVLAQEFRNRSNIFWTREPMTLLFHSIIIGNSRYLVELHHRPSWLTTKIIKFLKRRNEIEIIVLSESLANFYRQIFPYSRIVVIPMGVPDNFFVNRKPLSRSFSVCYLGKGQSSGFDNKLELIIEAAKILEHEEIIIFHFIGLEDEYKDNLVKEILKLNLDISNFIFHDQMPHSEVPKVLAQVDIGLLPYPESIYNSERFPIKVLEYAAAGLPIIASDTISHRNLINNTFTTFYSSENPYALAEAIKQVRSNAEVQMSMSYSARLFAQEYKYDLRAQLLMNVIGKNQ